MSDYDYGPLQSWEITWKSGHIETVQGHQVLFDSAKLSASALFGGVLGTTTGTDLPPRFHIHGQFDGRWRLVLSALESELVSIRDVTDRERVPEGGAAA